MADNDTSIQTINKTVTINARPTQVWAALTVPSLMKKWMSETDIDIVTDWKPGGTITIGGDWYKSRFENRGKVLAFEPERVLAYSHLSSLSRLEDENYSLITFALTPIDYQTIVALTIINFPTEIIYKHLAFYWNVALELLRRQVEGVV